MEYTETQTDWKLQADAAIENGYIAEAPRLTSREMEVLLLIAEGCSSKDVGELLFISWRTVEFYKRTLYEKLQVSSRIAAYHRATSLGLLPKSNI